MSVKKLLVIDGCTYCPYLEQDYNHKDFYLCNKLKVYGGGGSNLKHLFKLCPLPTMGGEKVADAPVKQEEEVVTYENYTPQLDLNTETYDKLMN